MTPDPETMESAVLQAMVVRAQDGLSSASIRQLARATGLTRQKVTNITQRLVDTGQISVSQKSDGKSSIVWRITEAHSTSIKVANTVAHNAEEGFGNAVPTMPFQLLPPSGVGSSWFELVSRELTRAFSDAASGRISVECRKCADTGYFLEKVSEEYSRDWLKTCECEAGQWKVIPDAPDYLPPSALGLCLMCENTGWVMVSGQAQRCYSCRKTFA
jgi:hypothetical protein